MARRRFIAPLRADVPASRFQHPVFSQLESHRRLFSDSDWPALADLDAALEETLAAMEPSSAPRLRFVAQTEALLADGLHYETRIHERGEIATRPENWHDLFNALAWLRHPSLKLALNRRQAADVARLGPRHRSRGQEAMTQFDEAGCIVLLRDPGLLALWDAHDWLALFWREREAWSDGRIEWMVFGHALFEHALEPELLLVGKCLVATTAQAEDGVGQALERIAGGINDGRLLLDPLELRPLPLSGIPGWHPDTGSQAFYRSAPCFRARRPDRSYPSPSPL
jgi:hypothetical protein